MEQSEWHYQFICIDTTAAKPRQVCRFLDIFNVLILVGNDFISRLKKKTILVSLKKQARQKGKENNHFYLLILEMYVHFFIETK